MSKPIPKGEVIETNFTKYIDRRFIGSQELIGKGQVALTVDRVEFHAELKFENGRTKKDAKLLYFTETPKPILLNKTKWDILISETNSIDPIDWKGLSVKLSWALTNFGGKIVDCINFNDDKWQSHIERKKKLDEEERKKKEKIEKANNQPQSDTARKEIIK